MFFLIFWIGFSIGIGAWAQSFDRNFIGWTFIALLLSPVIAVIILLGVGRLEEEGKKCPKCAEMVKPEAQVCKHCGHEFAAAAPSTVAPA